MEERIKDYDSEPVKFCPKCYSLQIGYIEGVENSDYCMKCGCSEVVEASISDWEKLYENRYGHKYVEKDRDPYRKHIYQMSLMELKTELYNRDDYRKIIERLYPSFPKYFTREEAVIVFFDQVCKDKEVDTVKDLLTNQR